MDKSPEQKPYTGDIDLDEDDDDYTGDFNPAQWLEDEFGIDVSDPRKVYYAYGFIQQALWYFHKLFGVYDEFTTYFNDCLYHQADPQSYDEWIKTHGGHQLYLLLYIKGGTPEIEEIYADYDKANERFMELSEKDELGVVMHIPPDFYEGIQGFTHATDVEEKNDLILKTAPVTWERLPPTMQEYRDALSKAQEEEEP